MSYSIKLQVSGNFACFTRPEMKVERVTYDVITPFRCARDLGGNLLEASDSLEHRLFHSARMSPVSEPRRQESTQFEPERGRFSRCQCGRTMR